MNTYEFICKPENAVILQDFKCLVVLKRLLNEYFNENKFMIGAPEEYAKWYPVYIELWDKCKVVNKKPLSDCELQQTIGRVSEDLQAEEQAQLLKELMKY